MTIALAICAVLFDMDGVVADTQESVTRFWRQVASRHGVELTAADFSRHVYGVPASHTFDHLLPGLDEGERQRVLDLMYENEAAGSYRAIPGALSLLHALRAHHIPAALVTSAESGKVEVVSRDLGLHGLFAATVTRDDIHRGKPDPEGYLLAASRLGVPARRCLVLEDAVSGVEAAVAAGSLCIGVTGTEAPDSLLLAGALAVVPDLHGIAIDHSSGRPWLVAAGVPFARLISPAAPAPEERRHADVR